MRIYRNNWRGGLSKALADTYFVCERLVGKAFFQLLAHKYMNEHPSLSNSLNDYGGHFADFLAVSPSLISEVPYLPDVARLEWAIHSVLVAPNPRHEAFNWELLNNIPEEVYQNLILYRVQPGLLLQSEFPVDRIWETNQDNFTGEDSIHLDEGTVYLFIGRKGFDLKIRRLNKWQWQLLNLLDDNTNLGELGSALDLQEGEEAESVLTLLPPLIKGGYITHFVLPGTVFPE